MNKKVVLLIPLLLLVVGLIRLPNIIHPAEGTIGSNVEIVDHNSAYTGGLIFTIHYVAYGHVKNFGWLSSGPIQMQLTIFGGSNNTGPIVYQTTFSPIPSVLGAGETGSYSVPFSTDDMGGYRGNMTYDVKILSQ